MSIKREVVLEYINKFPNSSKKSLANLIYKENPELFINAENARTIIRYYTGTNGDKAREKILSSNSLIDYCSIIPEPDNENYDPFILPSSSKNILLMSDIHIPFHDKQALEITLDYAKKNKVDTILLNGDIVDCYAISKFITDPRKRHLKEEVKMWRMFIESLISVLPNTKIYFKEGNHEERLEKYLMVKAPELLGFSEYQLPTIMRFGEYGIDWIGEKRIIHCGKLNILHGHEFNAGGDGGVNPARWLYLRAKQNCIIGHYHRTSEHTEPNLNGKIISCWSTGSLCYQHPAYRPINKWNLGFANILRDGEEFNIKNMRIVNYKLMAV